MSTKHQTHGIQPSFNGNGHEDSRGPRSKATEMQKVIRDVFESNRERMIPAALLSIGYSTDVG